MNVATRTFLITLKGGIVHIFQSGDEFLNILKEDDKTGIEYIKKFDGSKDAFKKISKKDILSQFNWHTELILLLQKHSYFK